MLQSIRTCRVRNAFLHMPHAKYAAEREKLLYAHFVAVSNCPDGTVSRNSLARVSMMPITIGCPACGKRFRARQESAGKRVRCPYCQAAVPVPSEEESQTAGAPTEIVPDPPEPPAAFQQPAHTPRREGVELPLTTRTQGPPCPHRAGERVGDRAFAFRARPATPRANPLECRTAATRTCTQAITLRQPARSQFQAFARNGRSLSQ